MPRRKINYQEGSCFFIPLRNGGGYARGVVARCDGTGGVFAYFFGPKLTSPKGSFSELKPENAVLIGMCGDPGFLKKEWPVDGILEGWDRANWPMPPLYRDDEIEKIAWLTYYDEDNLEELREEPTEFGNPLSYPYDRLMGYVAAEIRVTQMLNAQ